MIDNKLLIVGAGLLAVLGIMYVKKKGIGTVAADVGAAVGGAVVDAVDGAVTGGVLAIGDKIGVPRTDETECQKALREGRTWDASFACDAGTFIKSWW